MGNRGKPVSAKEAQKAIKKKVTENENEVIKGSADAAKKRSAGKPLTEKEAYVLEVADDIIARRAGGN